jgi:hypothetical protein
MGYHGQVAYGRPVHLGLVWRRLRPQQHHHRVRGDCCRASPWVPLGIHICVGTTVGGALGCLRGSTWLASCRGLPLCTVTRPCPISLLAGRCPSPKTCWKAPSPMPCPRWKICSTLGCPGGAMGGGACAWGPLGPWVVSTSLALLALRVRMRVQGAGCVQQWWVTLQAWVPHSAPGRPCAPVLTGGCPPTLNPLASVPGLGGQIPGSLSTLTALQWLALNDNTFTGTVPPLEALTALT